VMTPTDVTTFTATARLTAAPIALAAFFFTPLWPAFSDASARRDEVWIKAAFRRATIGGLLVMVVPAAVLVVVGTRLVGAWTRGLAQPPQALLIASAIWLIVYAVNQPQAMLLNALHVVRWQLWCASLTVVANVALSIYLTMHVGVSGPLWGTLASQVALTLVPTTIFIRRVLLARAQVDPAHSVPESGVGVGSAA